MWFKAFLTWDGICVYFVQNPLKQWKINLGALRLISLCSYFFTFQFGKIIYFDIFNIMYLQSNMERL